MPKIALLPAGVLPLQDTDEFALDQDTATRRLALSDLVEHVETALGIAAMGTDIGDLQTAQAALEMIVVPFVIDGGGSVITTGSKGLIRIPSDMRINNVQVVADQSGDIVIDVKRATYANLPTTASIAASAKPTLSAVQKSTDSTLTGWTVDLTGGDWLEFVVDSVATVTRVTVVLNGVRTY